MGRGRRGTLSLVVSGPISRTVPVARVGSRDHERVVGDVVVSRLRSDDARVPRLRIAVPASAFVFLEGFEVVAGKGSSGGPPPWYDFPVYFHSCPGCGASPNDIDWS